MPNSAPQPREAIFVSPQWLSERLGAPGIAIVDGSYYLSTMNRDAKAEFLAGHIPGAVHFDIDTVRDATSPYPHMMPSAQAFAAAVGAMGIGDGMTIIVYDGMGMFSAPRVRWMFQRFGASDVRLLDGGLPAWQAAGLGLEEGPAKPRHAAQFTPRFDMTAVADIVDVKGALASGAAQVVDARPADRFRGETPEPRAGIASGHMPGAKNLPFGAILDNGRLKEPAAIKAAFAEAGIDTTKPIITSCGSGVSAVILSTALELIGQPAKSVYDGSWAEWGSDPANPVATSRRTT
ncbi:MAG: 3-mercaptopyruvate sulfurtransferase [Bosea sp. (in: a-proteobacteria)]